MIGQTQGAVVSEQSQLPSCAKQDSFGEDEEAFLTGQWHIV